MDPQTRWNDRYASIAVADLDPEPAGILVENLGLLPPGGTAIDIAGGTGRNALWLAEQGFDATVLDVSPVGLEVAQTWATSRGLSVATVAHDLETDGMAAGKWDVAVITLFLDRSVVLSLAEHLTVGGLGFFAQPTETNLERHDHPSRRFLMALGEVQEMAQQLAAQGCEVVEASEAWRANGSHEARLIVRRQREELSDTR